MGLIQIFGSAFGFSVATFLYLLNSDPLFVAINIGIGFLNLGMIIDEQVNKEKVWTDT